MKYFRAFYDPGSLITTWSYIIITIHVTRVDSRLSIVNHGICELLHKSDRERFIFIANVAENYKNIIYPSRRVIRLTAVECYSRSRKSAYLTTICKEIIIIIIYTN